MNIFVLDHNQKLAAQYHCDKHVVKMIVEYAQLLCTAHWMSGSQAQYRSTHKNHPCAVWTRECIENYEWLCVLANHLCDEYSSRYNKTHKTASVITWCTLNKPNLRINKHITPLPLCMPSEYKSECVVNSYRAFYLYEKSKFAKWNFSDTPPWYSQVIDSQLEKIS